jgi:hypothetical protein
MVLKVITPDNVLDFYMKIVNWFVEILICEEFISKRSKLFESLK